MQAPNHSALLAQEAAPFTSVQDLGRIGWRRFGITGAGAMDAEALATANVLVDNPIEAAAVEFAHAGGTWTLLGPSRRVALAGGHFTLAIDGRSVPCRTSILMQQGQTLTIGGSRDAVWGYLAIEGGISVTRDFGSRSTHLRSGVGGLGRLLQSGDSLPLGRTLSTTKPDRQTIGSPADAAPHPIRVVLGPQDDHFTPAGIRTFLEQEFRVTWQCDRMAYRLEGKPVEHAAGFNIVSDGLLPGSIQVPGSGQPIVLLRDAQTTGGYPKIATIITADLGRFAQSRPLRTVKFKAVSLEDAHLLRLEYVHRLRALHLGVRPQQESDTAISRVPPRRQPATAVPMAG